MIKADNIELIREQIYQFALLQHHKKYQHGKGAIDTFDCSGLVWYVYNEICHLDLFLDGIGLSTTTKIMTSKYGKLTLFEENCQNKNITLIKKGDILFFHRQSLQAYFPKKDNRYPGHCGIYLDNNSFIHASRVKGEVVVSNFLKNPYWLNVLVGYKDLFYKEENASLVYQLK